MARKSKDGDGRRNNCPPEHSQARKGDVLNPYGCRGAPKPGCKELTKTEKALLAEAERIVSQDENGPVSARKRVIQNLVLKALKSDSVRDYESLLSYLISIETKDEEEKQKAIEWFLFAKAHYSEAFRQARKRNALPPDVAHPDHFDIIDGELVISGPLNPEVREHWEIIKANITTADWRHKRAREAVRIDPSKKNVGELQEIESWRRKLMRRVPKGWNWRENIYCRDGHYADTHAMIQMLEDRYADAS